MTTDEYAGSVQTLRNAMVRLADALRQPKTEWTRDASIQRFEFTFELAWKTTMRFARREGLECASPRQAWRAALQLGWIEDDAVWLDMLDDRNRTSHTYNEHTAESIYARLPTYHQALATLLMRLEALLPPTTEAE